MIEVPIDQGEPLVCRAVLRTLLPAELREFATELIDKLAGMLLRQQVMLENSEGRRLERTLRTDTLFEQVPRSLRPTQR